VVEKEEGVGKKWFPDSPLGGKNRGLQDKHVYYTA